MLVDSIIDDLKQSVLVVYSFVVVRSRSLLCGGYVAVGRGARRSSLVESTEHTVLYYYFRQIVEGLV